MDPVTLQMAKNHTEDTLSGSGALKGEKGDPGVGIASVTQTTTSTESGGLNEWTATLTDGTESVLQVRNGQEGAEGFSPVITEHPDNTQASYKLEIETKGGKIATPNLQAVSFVENADVYSTEETVVGQWIDGKPIYRRTFVVSSLTADLSCTNTSDVECLVCAYGSIDTSSSQIAIPATGSGTSTASISLLVKNNNLHITSTGVYTGASCNATFEYTKTTDTATIAIPTTAEMTAAYAEGVQSA